MASSTKLFSSELMISIVLAPSVPVLSHPVARLGSWGSLGSEETL